ncbi:MAG TPA: HRDC domain-containing protein, partial [Pseudonocardiaceae bacterium]
MTQDAASEAVPLLVPSGGVPRVITDAAALDSVTSRLTAGTGPVAVDAERASGYRYSQRAYLVQLRREPVGTELIDPIGMPSDAFERLAAALAGVEWVLHAASQDLPCLAELGLAPDRLFDTELAGRLAGFERVGLASMVDRMLGISLRKGHGAADWSSRPLPHDWLTYAALDVELLLPLREALLAELSAQGKLAWAEQEFEAVRLAPPPPPRPEPWRRTSGIHRVRRPRQLAAVRELWVARDELAARRDLAPGRVLPDAAIIDAAVADPPSPAELTKLPVFRGRAQRRLAGAWADALHRARTLPRGELPEVSPSTDGPPPISRWADKDPAAAARLAAARTALNDLARLHRLPVENLLQPELVRRLCWQPPDGAAPPAVAGALRAGGARQ